VTEASPELVEQLAEPDARPSVERVFFIDVVSFDWNCPKYITPSIQRGGSPRCRDAAEETHRRIGESIAGG
jgi:uncharacterized protein